jgi:hypothetical protein
MSLVGSKGLKAWMEWNSLDPRILLEACGLDLPTFSSCKFQKNLNTTIKGCHMS